MYNHLYAYNQPQGSDTDDEPNAYTMKPPYYRQPMPLRSHQDYANYVSMAPQHGNMINMYHPIPPVYGDNNSAEINIVHSPSVGSDIPTTLPPLNTHTPLSSPKRHAAPWPGSNEDMMLRQTSSPIITNRTSLLQTMPTMPHYQEEQQHQRDLASEMNPYGCDIVGCYMSFSTGSALFQHVKNLHANQSVDKPFRCAMPRCSKRYKNVNGLQYHLRDAKGSSGHASIHPSGQDNNPKQYRCQLPGCKKKYRTHNGLQYHQAHTHSMEQPGSIMGQQQRFDSRSGEW